MPRLFVVLGVAIVAFTIYCIIDLLMTDRGRIRALNKPLWGVVILLVPVLGGILWLALGKDRSAPAGHARTTAPDDDPAFLSKLSRQEDQDERIRRLEQELAELDDDPPKE